MNTILTQSNLYEAAVNQCDDMRKALILLLGLLALLVIVSVVFTILDLRGRRRLGAASIIGYVGTLLMVVVCVFCLIRYNKAVAELDAVPPEPSTEATTVPETEPQTEPPTVETTEATEPPTEPEPALTPAMTADTDPDKWGVKWELMVNDQLTDSFQRNESVSFGRSEAYYPLPGIPSFRGNNYRTGASYGTADIQQKRLHEIWRRDVGSLDGWPGVGWTGQPLCVQWDDETKAIMNLYESKKAKEGLVEVICTTLDGYIYFYDLEDGSRTRDPMWIGMSFKGTASLDPRGYPILYAGSGLIYGKYPRMYAISLIDTTVLWEQDGGDSFAKRNWYAFDSSPMICAETDTIIWPGESGVLYTIKLNTQYDKAAGTLTMAPENIVKARYSTNTGRTVGFESSSIIVDNYVFIGDNGGMYFCVDLNTMKLIWAQDIGDDLNATPVFEWGEGGQGYLYLATSMEYGNGTCNIFKLNANSGEVVWKKAYSGITYDKDVSGGVLSSPVLGKPGTDLEGKLICAVAKTPSYYTGYLFALDTQTGDVVWEEKMDNYTWSSPVALYNEEGKGYIAVADSGGYMHLVDGASGETLYSLPLGSNVEASPIAFDNRIVIGTRGNGIYGIEVS